MTCPFRQRKAGVYLIANTVSGDYYVGSSYRWLDRWKGHAAEMRRGKHQVPAFNALVQQHGIESFRFLLLEECGFIYGAPLVRREHRWIDALSPTLNAPAPGGVPRSLRREQLAAWRVLGCKVDDLLKR